MRLVEKSLRDTFAHRVDVLPVVDGIADRVVVGAQRVRRRRAVAASAVAALAVALIAFGGVTIATRPGTQADPGGSTRPSVTGSVRPSTAVTTAPATAIPLDVVVGGTIYLAGGGTLALPAVGTMSVSNVWRVATGYLVSVSKLDYGTGQSLASLLYVQTSGDSTTLVAGESVLVAAGTPERPGVQVAWRDDGGVHVGNFVNGAVTNVLSTQVPDVDINGLTWKVRLYPKAVVGGAVVLAGTKTGGGPDTWDVWFPARGGYVPATDAARTFTAMNGVTADRQRILGHYAGSAGSKQGCLGEWDPDGFTVVRQVCPNPLGLDDQVVISPGGRWWMVNGPTGLRLYDAGSVWSGAGPVQTWPAGAPYGVWADDSSFVTQQAKAAPLVMVHTDGRAQDEFALPADTLNPILVVDLR